MPSEAMKTIVAGHERRLTNLEDGLHEMAAGLATNTAHLEGLSDKMDLSTQLVVQEMKTLLAPFTERLDQHISIDAQKTADIQDDINRLDVDRDKLLKLEGRELERNRRRHTFLKFAVPITIAITGWVTHYFSDVLFRMHGK